MAKPTWAKGTPLQEQLQARLRALIAEYGDKGAAEKLELSISTVVRGAAGCHLRRVTLFALESRLGGTSKAA